MRISEKFALFILEKESEMKNIAEEFQKEHEYLT